MTRTATQHSDHVCFGQMSNWIVLLLVVALGDVMPSSSSSSSSRELDIEHSYGGRWCSEAASESFEISAVGGGVDPAVASLLWAHETR